MKTLRQGNRCWFGPLVIGLALASGACTKTPASKEAAGEFMDAYYVRASARDATPFTTGPARGKLEDELRNLQGVESAPESDRPRVSYSLEEERVGADSASYGYAVEAWGDGVDRLRVRVEVRKQGGRWLVTDFVEHEAAPS